MRATPLHERRRAKGSGFDVAAVLELNLDRFPTKAGMLTLLGSWRYGAEGSGLASSRPDYMHALTRATEVMKEAPDPPHAIVQLWRRGDDGLQAA